MSKEKEINIGAEIVATASEPTKTVEEMKSIMGEVEDAPGGSDAPGAPPQAEFQTGPTPIPPQTPFVMPPDLINPAPGSDTKSEPASDDIFNPEIHCVDVAGNPIKTKSGKFRRKRGKSGTSVAKEAEFREFQSAAPQSTVQLMAMMVDCLTIVTATYFGDEWKAKEAERALMVDTYARYVHYKGWDSSFGPETALVMVTFGYLMPRIMTPKFFQQIKELTGHAHSNNRTPGVGENITRENHRPASGEARNIVRDSGPPPVGGMGGTVNISDLNRQLDKRGGQKPA